jgi:hypothetical protein
MDDDTRKKFFVHTATTVWAYSPDGARKVVEKLFREQRVVNGITSSSVYRIDDADTGAPAT